ncbi:MAG: Plug domain-containing protein, partial [Bacteroidota bacterium]
VQDEQLLNAATGISKMSISPAALATLPSFGEKDVFRSLQLLPGISGSNESSSGLFVRGGTPDQNLILFDGFTVYHVDHLFGFFSAFNANAIKDVQLYKGGFGAKYGGRLSSVVELTGKDGNSEQFNVGVGLSLLSVNAFAEVPLFKGKGSLLLAGRRSFQSGFYSNIFDAFTEANATNATNANGGGGRFAQLEVQPNSYFYDLNARISFRPTSKDVLALSFFNGQDNLDNSRNIDESALRGRGRFGGSGELDFSFDQQKLSLFH